MDAKDTLKYTIGVDIVTNMLKSHAMQLIMNQTAGNQTATQQQVIKLGKLRLLHNP